MKKLTVNQFINSLKAELPYNASYEDYYIGITNDIERRLQEHQVDTDNGWYRYGETFNKEDAETIEKYFLEKGMQGDTGGGKPETVFVYCYRVTNTTIESIY